MCCFIRDSGALGLLGHFAKEVDVSDGMAVDVFRCQEEYQFGDVTKKAMNKAMDAISSFTGNEEPNKNRWLDGTFSSATTKFNFHLPYLTFVPKKTSKQKGTVSPEQHKLHPFFPPLFSSR